MAAVLPNKEPSVLDLLAAIGPAPEKPVPRMPSIASIFGTEANTGTFLDKILNYRGVLGNRPPQSLADKTMQAKRLTTALAMQTMMPGGPMRIYIGQKAKTANLPMLKQAKALAAKGTPTPVLKGNAYVTFGDAVGGARSAVRETIKPESAVVKVGDRVFGPGQTHAQVYETIPDELLSHLSPHEQGKIVSDGFLTSTGRFVSSTEAKKYAPKSAIEFVPKDQRLLSEHISRDFNDQVKQARQPKPGDITTPEFKNWFGNSKVTGMGGKPKVVFHSTESDIDAFDHAYTGLGFHFGNKDQVEHRLKWKEKERRDYGFISTTPVGEGGRLMPVYLSIKNPVRMKDVGMWEDAAVVAEAMAEMPEFAQESNNIMEIMDEAIEIKDTFESYSIPMHSEAYEFEYGYIESDENKELLRELRQMFREAGFDGIVYHNEGEASADYTDSDSWIALDPEQVKSTFNRGKWNPEKSDLLSFNNLVRREKRGLV